MRVRGAAGMAQETREKSSTPEKFRPHGVQNDWLRKARGQAIQVSLVDGRLLNGRLVEDDTYCISLVESSKEESTLVYKHAICSVSISRE